jgi:branched-chain amino acid transport system substrate-binding protein
MRATMAEVEGRAGEPQVSASGRAPSGGSPTRGFLFADLRDYTLYVESNGAAAAADLLLRYRSVVREAVARYDGSEIKTEGDSFYVVFAAVSAAVQCGLAIAEAASHPTGDPAPPPIPVGIGIHAGETVETPDGFVGSAVNIAARICAVAKPGEVLVSETVRALTQTVLPVTFTPRGRKSLKGVSEPVAVYAVTASTDAWAAGTTRRSRRLALAGGVIVLVAVVAVVGALAWVRLHPAAGLPAGTWKIGIEAPLTGTIRERGQRVLNSVKLAVDEVNAAGGIDGSAIALEPMDDNGGTADDVQDPAVGAANTQKLAADPSVLAMVGPWGSNVALKEVPVSNAAGLLQCSGSNSEPGLTKPRYGALDLRSAHPDRINYIRTFPSDDIQATAVASFIYNDLAARRTLVVDDADVGRAIADQFTAAYQKLGGQVVRQALNKGADPATVLQALSDTSQPIGALFFGGFTETGAPQVRKAMAVEGHGDVPFVSWDGIDDGSGADDGSFIQTAGAAAAGSYHSRASSAPQKADFADRYRAAYGTEPPGFADTAYACAQVILDALKGVAATAPAADQLREAVRAYAVDPSHAYQTAIGTVGFDKNGDSLQQFVTFYRVEPSAAGGKGDWVVDKQQDYGPAP